jgi:LysR family transcriptional activator of glutamate synthase operon
MELRHLRYLVAVAQEGQFVRAAATLHVAQSALSQQIRDLERELGAELLHRDRRGVTPTPAGDVLLGHARVILARTEVARAEVAQLSGVISGTLRIASGGPSGPVPLPATLAEFQRRHPEVEITIQDAPSDDLVRWLREGTADVAVVTVAPETLPESVQGTLVARDRLFALVPRVHRLAGSSQISLAQLAAEPLVTFPRGSGVRSAIDEAFRAAGIPVARITAETIDPLALIELVGAGLGIALASASYAELAGPDVTVIPLQAPGVEHAVTLAWSRERRAAPALDAFLELAADWLPGPPPNIRAP